MKNRAIIILSMFVVLVTGCQSTPEEISTDLQPREYFQKAQEAVVERSDYDTALFYYQTFLERFPDDIQRSAEAEYEVAFIHYKQDDLVTAEQLFTDLLARYEAEGAELLPVWPRALSLKLLETIRTASSETQE